MFRIGEFAQIGRVSGRQLRHYDRLGLLQPRNHAEHARLLVALWPLLAPGVRLLYVTCSVLPAENEAVVEAFLAAHGDAAEDSLLPNYNIRDVMCRRARGFQILPGHDGLDGFYYACLGKRA